MNLFAHHRSLLYDARLQVKASGQRGTAKATSKTMKVNGKMTWRTEKERSVEESLRADASVDDAAVLGAPLSLCSHSLFSPLFSFSRAGLTASLVA